MGEFWLITVGKVDGGIIECTPVWEIHDKKFVDKIKGLCRTQYSKEIKQYGNIE